MTSYLFLAGAIICEVIGTLLLPYSKNFTKVYPSILLVVFYMVAFVFFILCREGYSPNDCLCNLVRCGYLSGIRGKLFSLWTIPSLAGNNRTGPDCGWGNLSQWLQSEFILVIVLSL